MTPATKAKIMPQKKKHTNESKWLREPFLPRSCCNFWWVWRLPLIQTHCCHPKRHRKPRLPPPLLLSGPASHITRRGPPPPTALKKGGSPPPPLPEDHKEEGGGGGAKGGKGEEGAGGR
uniref:Uncharacterized protein n=1 Tax=Heterosigma akashiwo TaxID=2829 RepID=A0A7S3XTE5_HETAK